MKHYVPASATLELNEVTEAPGEMALIGCCLVGGVDIFLEVSNLIEPEVFEHQKFRDAFELMAEMLTDSQEINIATVMVAWGQKNGSPCPPCVFLSWDLIPSPFAYPVFVEVLIESYNRRKVAQVASQALNAAAEGGNTSEELKAILDSVELGMEHGAFMEGKGPLAEAWRKSLAQQMKKSDGLAGLSTGFRSVDRISDGLAPSTMSVVAARPSEGKTALGLSFLFQMCFVQKMPCLFISLEMTKEAILNRLAANFTGIDARTVRRAIFTDDQKVKVKAFYDLISESPFWISYAPGATVSDIERLTRTAVKRHQVVAVFLDYIQIVRYQGKLSTSHEQIKETSQRLSEIPKRYGPHLCTLAQVNRKSAEENRAPKINEIAGSDQIEKDAELVMLLHRPKNDKGYRGEESILALAKVREGEPSAARLKFDGPRVRFLDPSSIVHEEDIPTQTEMEHDQ